jgi:hypothetical protein
LSPVILMKTHSCGTGAKKQLDDKIFTLVREIL